MSDHYYKKKYKEYKEKYEQEKNKKKDCQPIVNVNVNCDEIKESVQASAFKAVNISTVQMVTANVPITPVRYPDEIFDLNNEYDPETSAFIPKQDGIYLVIAGINFIPNTVTNYRVLILIHVNGIPVAADNDFYGEIPIGDVTRVSAILALKTGDVVNVSTLVSTDGFINPNPDAFTTQFEAARFPSPNHMAMNNSCANRNPISGSLPQSTVQSHY
jgi:hypothetical protein